MTVIIDTSVLVAYLLQEGGSEGIRELLLEGVQSLPLIMKESCNALLEARKQNRINQEDSEGKLKALLTLSEANIKMLPQEALLPDAFKIASENNLTVYDSLYIALARNQNSSLASRDKKQIAIAEKLGVNVLKI